MPPRIPGLSTSPFLGREEFQELDAVSLRGLVPWHYSVPKMVEDIFVLLLLLLVVEKAFTFKKKSLLVFILLVATLKCPTVMGTDS